MFWRSLKLTFISILFFLLGGGSQSFSDLGERVRAFTRPVEFDFVAWTLDAALIKLEHAAQGSTHYLDLSTASQMVLNYLTLISQIELAESELNIFYADPDPGSLSARIEEKQTYLARLYRQREQSASFVESILQAQVAAVVIDLGLAYGGQVIPPVLFHTTPLPWALIVSPRDSIQQEANISLETRLVLEEHLTLEEKVAISLDVSTLVVPVGGIGSYPTMVGQSNNINWMVEVISHEWIHNYLTLRPLGLVYERNQDLRTMNETTANIAGIEIGGAVIERFYPQLLPPAPPSPEDSSREQEAFSQSSDLVFDFRAEMHATRVRVDELLYEGKIEEAENYMEVRRLVFWENGYLIRKLNQAYFAFYGSYADTPIGPAGEDPVGAAVRVLRTASPTLVDFLRQMSILTSYEQLKARIK